MWKWAQGAVASVTGAAEPEYGADAFMAVDRTVEGRNPYGQLLKGDLNWQQPSQSHVETQIFYFKGPDGYFGFAQLIHSNPVNITFTSQFTFLLVNKHDTKYKLWTSTNLDNSEISGSSFKADGCKLTLNDDQTEFKFTSVVNEQSQIDLVFKVVDKGFKIGADGCSRYGEDLANPWGVMRHVFWPLCKASGRIVAKGVTIELKDQTAMYIGALQGMKPHHAAARWNFLNFQGPTLSIIVMEFTTPHSYGYGRSSVGAVVKDGKLLATMVGVKVTHIDPKNDDVDWPRPSSISFELTGPKVGVPDAVVSKPENIVTAKVQGKLNRLVDRVDVMSEIPAFVKRVAAGISGARPYIYQFLNDMEANVTVDGETFTETGLTYNEATFIS